MSRTTRSRCVSVCLGLVAALLLAGSMGAAPPKKTAAAAPPKKATDAGVRFAALHPTVEVAADFGWTVPIVVANTSTMGLYVDSLICDMEDTSPGETRADRHSRANLRILISQIESLSSGDSVIIQHQAPAQFEKGTLKYSIYGHRSNKEAVVARVEVATLPGVMASCPSRTALSGGRKVEWVYLPSGSGTASPGLVIVHGHASHARLMMRAGQLFANQGYSVALVSMPGYGLSEGPADLMGPATLAAVSAATDSFLLMPEVDRARIGVVGVSRGATVAANLAASRKDVRAALCQSGIYDLWSVYRDTQLPGFRETIVAEAGSDSAAWKVRSPALQVAAIKVPLYVLHGERDKQVPTAQAHAFESALKAAGGTVESQFPATASHQIPMSLMYKAGVDFFGRTLK